MQMTKALTHVLAPVELELAITAEELSDILAKNGVQGFRAMLDIAERTEDHVQMLELSTLIDFAKASGVTALTYDVTYFPHADNEEVDYQLNQLAHDLEIDADVIRDLCEEEIKEYLALDAERDATLPVHTIVEAYIGGTAFAWYGTREYPRLKRVILRKLAKGGDRAKRAFVRRASKAQVEAHTSY